MCQYLQSTPAFDYMKILYYRTKFNIHQQIFRMIISWQVNMYIVSVDHKSYLKYKPQ